MANLGIKHEKNRKITVTLPAASAAIKKPLKITGIYAPVSVETSGNDKINNQTSFDLAENETITFFPKIRLTDEGENEFYWEIE